MIICGLDANQELREAEIRKFTRMKGERVKEMEKKNGKKQSDE